MSVSDASDNLMFPDFTTLRESEDRSQLVVVKKKFDDVFDYFSLSVLPPALVSISFTLLAIKRMVLLQVHCPFGGLFLFQMRFSLQFLPFKGSGSGFLKNTLRNSWF